MRPITILVPTARQPQLLEAALASIARQTALDSVAEVIVSENLGDRQSLVVCEKFSSLPIRYTAQEPQLSLGEHFHFLFNQSRTDFTAFICDDDWWAPGHLDSALGALADSPGASSWFAASMFVESALARSAHIHLPPILWLAAGRPDPVATWALSLEQVLAASAILTPFHISSMVARSQPLRDASPIVLSTHRYQLDRKLFVELAIRGSVLYDPQPDTFVRWYDSNLTKRMDYREREAEFRRCSEDIWQMGADRGLDLEAAWHRYLADLPPAIRQEVARAFRRSMATGTLDRRHFGEFRLSSLALARHRASRLFRRLTG